jgi:hypothetical protein
MPSTEDIHSICMYLFNKLPTRQFRGPTPLYRRPRKNGPTPWYLSRPV